MLLASVPPASGGGNAKYYLIGVAFAAAAVGVFFAIRPKPPAPEPAPAPRAAEDAGAQPRPTLGDEELIIPDDEPDAGAPDAGTNTTRTVRHVVRDDWECTGSLAPAAAQAIIAENRAQVRSCYERALKMNNMLEGTLNVTVRVDGNGRVTGTRLGGTLRDNQVFQCVRNLSESWRFPSPTGGRCAVLSAPFNFTARR